MINLISNFFSKIIISITTFIITSLLSYFYDVNPRIIKFFHKYIMNSRSPIILNISYTTNVNFIEFKEKIKNYFRKEYHKLIVFKSQNSLKIQLNGTFVVSIFENGDDEISIITSKLPTTLRNIKKETKRFLNVLKKIKKEYNLKLKNKLLFFDEKEFSIKLFLPYKGRYVKIYSPKRMKIKKYNITFSDIDCESVIQLKSNVMDINSSDQSELESVINRIV